MHVQCSEVFYMRANGPKSTKSIPYTLNGRPVSETNHSILCLTESVSTKSIENVIMVKVYLIRLKIPQRTARARRSTKVNSVNSVLADTQEAYLMEDHMSRVYHASVVETRTSVILRLESAWIINTVPPQVWNYSWPWQHYALRF